MSHQDIGTAIRNRRHHLGLTQEYVADLAGVARRTISDLEGGRGSRGTTLEKVRAVCWALGLELVIVDAGSDNDRDRR